MKVKFVKGKYRSFHDGVAFVQAALLRVLGRRWALIAKDAFKNKDIDKMSFIIPPLLNEVGPFSEEGYAHVQLFENELADYEIKTDAGLTMKFEEFFYPKEMCTAAFFWALYDYWKNNYRYSSVTGFRYNFIDTSGNPIFSQWYRERIGYSEGLFKIEVNDKTGFIDSTGKVVIEPQFERAYAFQEGLAAVKVGDKWGFIDTSGNIVIKPQFAFGAYFKEGLASVFVREEDKGYYINKAGTRVLGPFNFKPESFSEGLVPIGTYI